MLRNITRIAPRGWTWTAPVIHHRCIHAAQKPSTTTKTRTKNPDYTDTQRKVRAEITKICSQFPDPYWADLDTKHQFPSDFHATLAQKGWLGICMPAAYGGLDHGLAEASVMMQTIAESGGGMAAASSVHMNIFGLEPVVKFGTEEQKRRWLIPLIKGEDKACFGVTEPNTGLDTLKLKSLAKKRGDEYILSGQKIWISTAQHAEKILILVRTTPLSEVSKPSQGLSLFYTDLDRSAVDVRQIKKMGRGAVDSNELFFDDWRVPESDLVGEENHGFKMIMHGMNAERILIASEALGLGFAALRHVTQYASETKSFDRLIGMNQSIQHPLADTWMKLESARLMVNQAAKLYDQGYTEGEYANAGKYLAAEAAFEACERAVLFLGEKGYDREMHVERYLREAWIPRLAPVSREMICNYIGQRVLGLPKSY
ncbi:acyl-CoA dehydrogenase/oxidase [Aspergillus unguis]